MLSKLKNRLGTTGLALVAALTLVVVSIAVPATAQPVASMSASVAKQVRQALGFSKKANKKATQAQRLARRAVKQTGTAGPQGPAGPAGPKGEAGPQGAVGPQGAAGPAGSAGSDGAAGTDGVSVTGEPLSPGEGGCAAGGVEYTAASGTDSVCNGEPWSAGGTLPSGETLVGQWAAPSAPAGPAFIALSFPIPLAATLASNAYHYVALGDTPPAECSGTPSNPTAAPGHMCVYAAGNGNPVAGPLAPGLPIILAGSTRTKAGVNLGFMIPNGATALPWGTFAVTAP